MRGHRQEQHKVDVPKGNAEPLPTVRSRSICSGSMIRTPVTLSGYNLTANGSMPLSHVRSRSQRLERQQLRHHVQCKNTVPRATGATV